MCLQRIRRDGSSRTQCCVYTSRPSDNKLRRVVAMFCSLVVISALPVFVAVTKEPQWTYGVHYRVQFVHSQDSSHWNSIHILTL